MIGVFVGGSADCAVEFNAPDCTHYVSKMTRRSLHNAFVTRSDNYFAACVRTLSISANAVLFVLGNVVSTKVARTPSVENGVINRLVGLYMSGIFKIM